MEPVPMRPRDEPGWLQWAVVAGLLLLHLFLVRDVLRASALYLGGDSAREGWRAWMLLSKGRLSYEYSVPYESGLYSVFFSPFLIVFGHGIRCLKAGAAFLSTATVLALFFFVRRKYGLLAGSTIAFLCAASPSFLANCAPSSEYAIPLWISLIMLLDSVDVRKEWVMLAAGILTSFQAYLLFPLCAYLLGKFSEQRALPGRRALLLRSAAFVAGLGPLILRQFYSGGSGPWFAALARANAARWSHPIASLAGLSQQFFGSLSSVQVYGPVKGTPAPLWLIVLWTALFAASLVIKQARRWALTLAIGLLLEGTLVSPLGLGIRHLLALVPFQWMMLAPLLAKVRKPRTVRVALIALSCGGALAATAVHWRIGRLPGLGQVADNTRELCRLVESQPGRQVLIESANTNLFFDLKFMTPSASVKIVSSADTEPHAGRVYISGDSMPDHPSGDSAYRLLKRCLLSGRTTYDIFVRSSGSYAG